MKQKRLLLLLALLMTAATGAWTQSATTTYSVGVKDATGHASEWTGKAGTEGDFGALPLKAAEGSTVTVTYTGTKKILGVDAKIYDPIATPLTMEVTATGEETSTIRINIDGTLTTGMKYSVNGGEKKIVTASTNIENLNVGDKVQFYGNGTETQMYGNKTSTGALVKIAGGSAKVKAYGNIMSLVDETGFATTTLQLQTRAFYLLVMR